MKDIYRKVNSSAVLCDYDNISDVNVKKQIVSDSLKLYLLNKIHEISPERDIKEVSLKSVTVEELIDLIGEIIPREQHFITMKFITQCIVDMASLLQDSKVVWAVENRPILMESPMATFNGEGKWRTIVTHGNTSYAKTAKFAYQIFKEQLLVKNDSKCLIYRKEQ